MSYPKTATFSSYCITIRAQRYFIYKYARKPLVISLISENPAKLLYTEVSEISSSSSSEFLLNASPYYERYTKLSPSSVPSHTLPAISYILFALHTSALPAGIFLALSITLAAKLPFMSFLYLK